MKKIMKTEALMLIVAVLSVTSTLQVMAQSRRTLWASICDKPGQDVTSSVELKRHYGKLLLSWRALPEDGYSMAYHVYRRLPSVWSLTRVSGSKAVNNATCLQTSTKPSEPTIYYLFDASIFTGTAPTTITDESQVAALLSQALDSLTVGENIYASHTPYISIPLKGTEDVCTRTDIVYQANDCSVADLDGDGVMEVVVKRLQTLLDAEGNVVSDGTAGQASQPDVRHNVIWDAYRLDGTFLWRLKSGPNIILGNSSNFALADLDGDGRAEMITRTAEGTVFGDGTEMGDTNGDGITDYRTWTGDWIDHYTSAGPDYFSVIEGATGRELARADFIDRGTSSEAWGDTYWKRANSMRLGIASFDGEHTQIFIGRGVYARIVTEGWDYRAHDGSPVLTRLWHFDSAAAGGADTNKDGKPNSAYKAQGNHSFNVADLDGDGRDEVMYGSCAFDDDGTGLWSTRLGHGDANHVGKFLPDRDGLQVWHCLESGKTMVALHDAATGATIWQKADSKDNDTGRCMVADIDPSSPGCEFWWYDSNAFSADGSTDLGYKPESSNMGVWFDGSLNRQLIDGDVIDSPKLYGRVFTLYRYDISYNNGTKKNPGWVGDFLGDWREEIIMPDATKLKDIKIFSTWYPTQHKFPWLMTDHTYYMSSVNENVGYNQPTNLGYYLGSDLVSDEEAWREAGASTAIRELSADGSSSTRGTGSHYYDLQGRRVSAEAKGIYIHQGKKVVIK